MTPILIGVAVTAASVALIVVVLRRAVTRADARLAEMGGGLPARRRTGALGFGIRSLGVTQLRGNGPLVLFDDELVFLQLIGPNHLRIRRDDVIAVTRVPSFLGKRTGRQLLHVEWRTEDGTDAAAWQVADLDGWMRDLEAWRS